MIDRIKRGPIAQQYLAEVQLKTRNDESFVENALTCERMKLSNQRAAEQARYTERRRDPWPTWPRSTTRQT